MRTTKWGAAAALAAIMAVPLAGAGSVQAKAFPGRTGLQPVAAERLSAALAPPSARMIKAGYWNSWPWYRYGGCCGGYGRWGGWGSGCCGGWGGWGGGGNGCYWGWGCGWGRWGRGWGGGWGGCCASYYPGYYGDYYGPYYDNPYY